MVTLLGWDLWGVGVRAMDIWIWIWLSGWNPWNCGGEYRLWAGYLIAWRRISWFVDGEVVVLVVWAPHRMGERLPSREWHAA